MTFKEELLTQVADIEKLIEANQDKMIDHQERISGLKDLNSRMTDQISKLMKRVREL